MTEEEFTTIITPEGDQNKYMIDPSNLDGIALSLRTAYENGRKDERMAIASRLLWDNNFIDPEDTIEYTLIRKEEYEKLSIEYSRKFKEEYGIEDEINIREDFKWPNLN